MAVTLKDVAELAGVSRQSVSRILGERAHLFKEETRNRVVRAAGELGYRPNAAARAIATSRTRQIGVLIANDAADPVTHTQAYYTLLGINLGLEAADYLVSLVRIGGINEELSAGSRVFREHVLDGIIVTTAIAPEITATVEKLVPTCVWLDTNTWRPTHSIRRDERDAGRKAAQAAVDAGYRKLLWWGNLEGTALPHYSHFEREHGFLDACAENDIGPARVYCRWELGPDTVDQIEPFLKPDTAVITYDVHRARMINEAALRLRRIPGVDFGTICCEDTPDLQRSCPSLSIVEFDRLSMGRRAAAMMLAALNTPSDAKAVESVRIQGNLISGSSLNSVALTDPTSAHHVSASQSYAQPRS